MKLSPLLVEYLHQEKELILGNIGKFTLHEPEILPDESARHGKKHKPGIISFEFGPVLKNDPGLIGFIAGRTGKMKSLVAADLISHSELAREFLNIGKSFQIEGIGTLTKNNAGEYEFVQDISQAEKQGAAVKPQFDQPPTSEESFTEYEEMLSPKKPVTPVSRKLLLAVAIIIGIGLAVWGGYIVYSANTKKPGKTPAVETPKTTSVTNKSLPDTSIKQETVKTESAGLIPYKYIVEESERQRALFRYADLVKWGIDVRMTTEDSARFKLFFIIPSLSTDTSRIRDSLSLLYTTRGRARVEN